MIKKHLLTVSFTVAFFLASCATPATYEMVPMPSLPPPAKAPSKTHPEGGYCKMRFDVDELGKPYNVKAIECSEDIYRASSVSSVKKWKYNPKIVSGNPVKRIGVEAQITFNFED